MAHHKYQTRQLEGARNQDWPAWYADYLLEGGIAELLQTSPAPEQLAQFLTDLHASYSALSEKEQLEMDWPSYYAPKLIKHFQTGDHA
ncbi:MAG: hypothetical protein DWQ07_22865 [Chloroflexi bacterium]|nr:MAG: hypothetical protein DWQ07_22865 [Chloroflexota bacterium]MBL1193991.1 hypothetical protein [Chloroflexota bacterium]NOH11285.1 hypothetical protein [Chloroflexota bacterium]